MAHVHFIGIGGYSMSGLAQVLAAEGDQVTGSELKASSRTQRLLDQGIAVCFGHRADNIDGADAVVYNTDVPADNVELVAARQRGLAVLHRSELLAKVLNRHLGIAVTGTHGKTTTTTMIGTLLEVAGFQPTVLIGGESDALGGNAKLGKGAFVVAEADESDGSFLRYTPHIAVVTNVEPEHLEHYGGRFEGVVDAVHHFLGQVHPGGWRVVCGDDPQLRAYMRASPPQTIAYGLDPGNQLRAADIEVRPGGGNRFAVWWDGARMGQIELAVPGRHNVQNALAALAVAKILDIKWDVAAQALRSFVNAHRRFEVHAEVGSVTVIDDYAHHPTEIRAVLKAAREFSPQRLVAVFQPQRYSRTQNLFEGFATAFEEADEVIVADIYAPPGEQPVPGVSAAALAERMRQHGHARVRHVGELEEISRLLWEEMKPGDFIVTMGAGDVFKVAQDLAARLHREAVSQP